MANNTKSSFGDASLLQAALEGLEIQRTRIEEQIQRVRSMMGGTGTGKKRGRPKKQAVAEEQAPERKPRKRQMNAQARKRIAAAQKKRWAEYRKNREAGS